MINTSPCTDCSERTVCCHAKCVKYKQWRDERQSRLELIAEAKHQYNIDSVQKKKSMIKNALKKKGR